MLSVVLIVTVFLSFYVSGSVFEWRAGTTSRYCRSFVSCVFVMGLVAWSKNDWLIDWKVSRQRSRVAEFVTVDVWQIQPRERVDSSRRRVGVSNCPWSVPAGGRGRSDWIHWRTPRGWQVAAAAVVTHFPPRTPRRFDCRYRRSAPDNYRLQTFTTYRTASLDWLPPAGSPVTPIARALRQVTEK